MTALIVVPTFNERGALATTLRLAVESTGPDVHILVVDDASPDGTAEIARREAAGCDRIFLMERDRKLGLGSAYLSGFAWALERGYDAVVEMDADLSHDPRSVTELLKHLDDAELVIGSRYVPGGRVENWGTVRRVLSSAGNTYARVLLGFRTRDSTSGFRAYRSSVLAPDLLASVRSDGYAFQIEMVYRVWRAGHRVVEVPITFSERTAGKSKLSRTIIVEAVWRVALWAVIHRLFRRPV